MFSLNVVFVLSDKIIREIGNLASLIPGSYPYSCMIREEKGFSVPPLIIKKSLGSVLIRCPYYLRENKDPLHKAKQ